MDFAAAHEAEPRGPIHAGEEIDRAAGDPRVDRTKKHALADILVVALTAAIAGAGSFEAVAASGQAKRARLASTVRDAQRRLGGRSPRRC